MIDSKISKPRVDKLHPLVRELFIVFIDECERQLGITLRVTQGLRTIAEQNELYSHGRTKFKDAQGNKLGIVTKAKGGFSYHNYGLACFSDDTEILTENGWKLFSDLDKSEMVMVFKDDKLYYELPTSFISNDYDGEMVSIQTRSVDLLVTPNHKMICKRKTTNKWSESWEEVLAENIDYKYKIPTAGDYNFTDVISDYPFSNLIDEETWWEFMGWYISEGTCCGVSDGIMRTHNSRYKVSISQKENSTEWHLIKDCLDRTGFKYNYIGHEFIIHSKELHSVLFVNGNSHQKRIPRYLYNAPKYLIEILYESLLLGDGTHYEKRESYWTVNKKLADDVAEMCVLLGKSVSIGVKLASEHLMPQGEMIKTFNLQYSVNNRNRKTQELRNGDNNFSCINKEYYNGVVYCVSTNAGAIVVKRNGKISICGNCDVVPIIDGKPKWDYDYSKLAAIADKYGIESGSKWKFKDNPHFQITDGYSVQQLLEKYNDGEVDENGYVKI